VLHGEIELAKLELRSSVKNAGAASACSSRGCAAGLLATFGLIALAEGIVAMHICGGPRTIVFGFLLLSSAHWCSWHQERQRVKAPSGPLRQQETVAYLKQHDQHA